jgi:hypothetical protein
MDPDGGNHEPNRKGCHREVGSEGSGTRTPGQEYHKHLNDLFRNKYKRLKFDFVLALHDEALSFLLKEGRDLYPEDPPHHWKQLC